MFACLMAGSVYAFRDAKGMAVTNAGAQGVVAAGAGVAADGVAGGTIRSLFQRKRGQFRDGKFVIEERGDKVQAIPVTGLTAVEPLAFSVSRKGSFTLWLIASAQILSAVALFFEDSAPGFVVIPTIVWIATIGSAISAFLTLVTPEELTIEEDRGRVTKARIIGVISFVILLFLYLAYFM